MRDVKYHQGLYKPKNPKKYKGNVETIRFLSSWELYAHQFFDNHPNVLEWSSERIKIPYLNPVDKKVHHYLPDYVVKFRDKYGHIRRTIIEVKPSNQTHLRKRATLQEKLTYAVNIAKWQACQRFCNKRGLEFQILTEKQLFR